MFEVPLDKYYHYAILPIIDNNENDDYILITNERWTDL